MAQENRSRFAVLGVLSYGAMSGYDIRKTIESTVGHFWSESYGQIYPILKELVVKGWATVTREEQESRPDRKVYSITPDGEAALKQWLAEPVTDSKVRNELLLKLFFGNKVDPGVTRQHLQDFRDVLHQQLTTYATIEAEVQEEEADPTDQVYWMATLSFGKYVSQALLEWSDHTLEQLNAIVPPPSGKNL